MTKTILLVEDDKDARKLIRTVLKRDVFKLYEVKTLKTGTDFLKKRSPDLMILDLILPDGNGLDLCRMARASARLAKTPIIALTALTDFSDKKQGFEAGVDQYLEKPIIIDELSLWVKALLRRVEWDSHGGPLISFGDLQICSESYIIKFGGKVTGNLTRREFELFSFLVRTSPKLISRAAIISKVWKTVSVDNLVDTHIFNLRQKLPPRLAERVQSVAGKGFRYLPPG